MAESNQKKSQKKFKGKKWILFLILIFFWWFNNYSLKTNSTSIKSAKISQPVRLAVLSDYHAHGLSISQGTILRKLEKINPDAVILLGDMYSRNSGESEINMAVELMAAIAALNETVKRIFDRSGIEIPYNQLDVRIIGEKNGRE